MRHFVPQTDENSAMAAVERLRRAIQDASIYCGAGMNIGVTISVGWADRGEKPAVKEQRNGRDRCGIGVAIAASFI